jgi:hypothetical protein
VSRRDVAPPGGTPPPTRAETPSGTVDLHARAGDACERYASEFPDERERYGDVGQAWCVHDNQHVFAWAIADVHGGHVDLLEQVGWLARVLEARDFPLERLARSLELCAEVAADRIDDAVAGRLGEAAAFVRSKPSFLG